MKSLAQQDDGASSDAGQRDTTTEEDAMEAITPLPACNGSNGPKGVNCRKVKLAPVCKGNKLPKLQPGEEAPCRLLPKNCSEAPGLVPGEECYQDQHSLVQVESHHRHKHHHKHHHRQDADDAAQPDAGQRDTQTEEDQTEAEPALPVCNGSNGTVGVDCLKPKPAKKKGLAQISH